MLGCAAACNSILGIGDPKPGGGPDDSGIDSAIDSNIDAPPPCTTSVSFKAEQTSEVGATGKDFAIGRFDLGNLNDDIAIATGTNVMILHGDGAGNFGGDGAKPIVATAADGLVVEDFDSDADDDLVMWTATAVVERRLNRALDPPVEAEQPLTGPFTNVKKVIAEQLDGNARPDVFVYDADAGSRVYTSLIGTPGTFSRDNLVGVGADELILTRQVDGMQRADAVFVNGNMVKLALQTNSFANPVNVATGANSKGIAMGKFDGDALPDLVVSTANGIVLFRQMSPGQFTMHGVISPVQSPTPMLVGDANDDGRDDIITPTAVILQCAGTGTGPGVFTQVEPLAVGSVAQLIDINGDTKPDLVRLDGTAVKVRLK